MDHTIWQLTRALWLVFAIYWIASAAATKPTKRSESAAQRLRHGVLLWAGYVLVLAPGAAATLRVVSADTGLELAGLGVTAAGVAFAIWARHTLGANWSGTVTIKEQHELVRRGPYALVRNPIYTGMVAATLGTALVGGSVLGIIGLALVVVAVLIKIRREESFLLEEFGEEFLAYRRQVRLLIPFVL